MTDLAARHARTAIDLGTGDGRFVLARAAAESSSLVIGVDASAAAMAEASRRASRAGLSNALFVAADALALPAGLAGIAHELTITLPWGSLLHAAVAADLRIMRLLRPGGALRLLVSASEADAGVGVAALEPDRMAGAWRAAGLADARIRPAGIADVRAASSSWGKRLLGVGATSDRSLWLLEGRRADERSAVG